MRIKSAPLRASGMEGTHSSFYKGEGHDHKTSASVKRERSQPSHDYSAGPQPRRSPASSRGPPTSTPMVDRDTEVAKAKLRHQEMMGHIKVEVDEFQGSGEDSSEELPEVQKTVTVPAAGRTMPKLHPLPVGGSYNFGGSAGSPSTIQHSQPLHNLAQVSCAHSNDVPGLVDGPLLSDMEGKYGFTVTVGEERSVKSPMWLMSRKLNKLYTNINKDVPFEVRLKNLSFKDAIRPKLFVRAVLAFSSPGLTRSNVTRCPNHAAPSDPTNHDFFHTNHVIRANHPHASYQESTTGRLSVVVPLDLHPSSPDFVPVLLCFMCLGSCVGGIGRRPISVVLILENSQGDVLGRKVIPVRVCACPSRDIKSDEEAASGRRLKRKGSSSQMVVERKLTRTVEPTADLTESASQEFTIKVRGLQLYIFLKGMKELYYNTHPEYAQQYPDPAIAAGSSERQSPLHSQEVVAKMEPYEETITGSESSSSNSPLDDSNLVIDVQEDGGAHRPAMNQHEQQGFTGTTAPRSGNLAMVNRETNGIDSSISPSTQGASVAFPALSHLKELSAPTLAKHLETSYSTQPTAATTTTKASGGSAHGDGVSVPNGITTPHILVRHVTKPSTKWGASHTLAKNTDLKAPVTTTSTTPTSTTTISTTTTTSTTTTSTITVLSQQNQRMSLTSREMIAANIMADRFAEKIEMH